MLTKRGVELPLPGQSTTTPETRAEHGRAVQAQIIGEEAVEQLYASAPEDEQHIQRFLSVNCFGDHLTRGGIDVPTREPLTFAMLVSLGGCEPQVRGHVAANLNVGSDRARLIDVLTQLIPFLGYLGGDAEAARDPRASPLLADDLGGVAPAHVVAGFDPLRDEGIAYARRLEEAGVEVTLRPFWGLVHGFVNATAMSRSSAHALGEVAQALRDALASAQAPTWIRSPAS